MKQKFEKNHMGIVAVEKIGFQGFPMMFHPHIEILCVLDGSIRVNVDSEEHILSSGEFCVVFPYVLHNYEDAPNTRFRLIMVAPQYLPGFEEHLLGGKVESPFFSLDDTNDFLTRKTVESIASGNTIGERTACGYISALMGEILQKTPLTNTNLPENTALKRLVIYCNQHYTEDITVRSAATACFISESLVSKLFAKEIGCPFRSYVNALRISYAKRLLRKTNTSITDIMYACGFQNQSSFNRVFFEQCGQTPRQFRNSAANLPEK